MSLDRAITLFAGFMVLLSLALTHWVHPAWVWLTVFVGFNLMQSSFTGFCPAAMVFRRLGVRPRDAASVSPIDRSPYVCPPPWAPPFAPPVRPLGDSA